MCQLPCEESFRGCRHLFCSHVIHWPPRGTSKTGKYSLTQVATCLRTGPCHLGRGERWTLEGHRRDSSRDPVHFGFGCLFSDRVQANLELRLHLPSPGITVCTTMLSPEEPVCLREIHLPWNSEDVSSGAQWLVAGMWQPTLRSPPSRTTPAQTAGGSLLNTPEPMATSISHQETEVRRCWRRVLAISLCGQTHRQTCLYLLKMSEIIE